MAARKAEGGLLCQDSRTDHAALTRAEGQGVLPIQESAAEMKAIESAKPLTLTAPKIIAACGAAAQFAWEEFFLGTIRNPHTRRSYRHAVERFLGWCQRHELELPRITPGMVGRYFDELQLSLPSKNCTWRPSAHSSTC